MKGTTGKAPSIQWYYKDWISDKRLQMASATSRGIWMNILMYMIDCSLEGDGCEAGMLESMSTRRLASLGGCTESEAEQFIEEAVELRFCDISVTGDGFVTIKSRRLSRDAKIRANARERKRKQREREAEKGKSHADVTDLSPPVSQDTPSPTPTPNNNILSSKPKIPHKKIVEYLNKKANTNFRHTTKKTQACIRARFNEGFTLDDFEKVIDLKSAQWKSDEKMVRYLRPETLFGTKFEGYLNENTAQDPFSGDKVAVC